MRVNHSETFKDNISGACTNSIKGNWNGLKNLIAPRNKTPNCENYLWVFIWRRVNNDNLWSGFIFALKDVEYE